MAVANANRNGTVGVPIWTADKYPSLAATMAVTRYAEAQLIVAESKLAANDMPGAVAAINAVRATRANANIRNP